jgi:hypothetical protein
MAIDGRSDNRPWYVLPRPWFIFPTAWQNLGPFILVCIIGSNLLANAKRHQHLGWWWWIGLALLVVGVVTILLNASWHLRRLWRARRATSPQ